MIPLLERSMAWLAPHRCIGCGQEDQVVCGACLPLLGQSPGTTCLRCGVVTDELALCTACRPAGKPGVPRVWIAATYDGPAEAVIHQLKFERVAAAAAPLARLITVRLPALSPETIIVPIPTAPSRIRIRGYDHCLLLAKELSRLTGLGYSAMLARRHGQRQVGASRRQRITQAASAFALPRPALAAGRSILLVDDVVTTGATLMAAAAVLRRAGAARVDIVAVAKGSLGAAP